MKAGVKRRVIGMTVLLVLLSAFFYLTQYLIFRKGHDTIFYIFQDLGFMFIQILLVTLIIDRFLNYREKLSMIKKLNMVIGVFFNEIGTDLLKSIASFDSNRDKISKAMLVKSQWTKQDFDQVKETAAKVECDLNCIKGDLNTLKTILVGKREFLVRLLENPNLLEHEAFTELLWAVFHLEDELSHRKDLKTLPQSDYAHIAGDMKRAYLLLIREWLQYMEHLKTDYPYLFSLAIRTNPFDPDAAVEVK
jgi:hypothetical protein